jgi:hypothetical protein
MGLKDKQRLRLAGVGLPWNFFRLYFNQSINDLLKNRSPTKVESLSE